MLFDVDVAQNNEYDKHFENEFKKQIFFSYRTLKTFIQVWIWQISKNKEFCFLHLLSYPFLIISHDWCQMLFKNYL